MPDVTPDFIYLDGPALTPDRKVAVGAWRIDVGRIPVLLLDTDLSADDLPSAAFGMGYAVGQDHVCVLADMIARVRSQRARFFGPGDNDANINSDFGILNLRLGVDIDDWNSTITLWGRNVTDERYYTTSFDAPLQLGRMNSYPTEPSTYGITFNKKWE